jgi:diphthine-ammonia ligase
MNVVALVSGGKDSCYSILKCLSHGHNVIALAHISPPHGIPEPDSFMYQSIASSAIPALASSLNLPLYTRQTSANAVITSLSYAPTDPADEVEDLAALLRDVKSAHPALSAVTAGALWSDYQRLRVESAAARAGLVSIAYLWRRPQEALLDEMVASGLRAIIVKVAAVGLDRRHVGRDLASMRPLLKSLEQRYGSHIAGEGGEYETLVLSLPIFSHEIVLDDHDVTVVCHTDDPVAPVYYLDITGARLASKAADSFAATIHGRIPPPPPIPTALEPIVGDVFFSPASALHPRILHDDACSPATRVSSHRVGAYVHAVVQCADVQIATAALCEAIALHCPSSPTPLCEALFVWVRLSSLEGDAYAKANSAYASSFGTPSCTPPPVRACVGTTGTGFPVTLEALARPGRRADISTSTLHVQSLSEWAPPCIGPYAQAVADGMPRRVLICGVLPLHAPTACIPSGLGGRAQARACMYNMARTLEATPTDMSLLLLVVAYVAADVFVADAVESEVRGLYSGMFAIVPVDSLPKNALVEICAVASATEEQSGNCEDEGRKETSTLRYAVLESLCVSDEVASDLCLQLSENVDEVLAMQVYVTGGCKDVMRTRIGAQMRAAVMVADVGWLAHGATALCIATLVEK